ncbi:MAG TPA: 2-dehydropantoate 2-reductase [Candidatus Krumholzibacteria bacterium]
MQFLVYGAGAVGSVLGGMLSVHKHDVCLVGRDAHIDTITADGLRIKSTTGEYVAHPTACKSILDADAAAAGCVVIAVKSQDVPATLDSIAPVVARGVPVLCIQNGVVAEEETAKRMDPVYGAVIRMTCSMVQPGHVSFQTGGRVIVGKYPKGADAAARSMAAAITEAGFDCIVSKDIMADKWLKVAVNVQSVFHAVIDGRDHDTNEFQALKVGILDETRRVFKAAKVRAKCCDGRDPSIEEMIETLRKPRTKRPEHGVKVRNSVWQDLYLKRRAIEAEFIHGPVIALGKEHGVPTPYNHAALEIVTRAHREGLGPESLRLSVVLAAIEREGTTR